MENDPNVKKDEASSFIRWVVKSSHETADHLSVLDVLLQESPFYSSSNMHGIVKKEQDHFVCPSARLAVQSEVPWI